MENATRVLRDYDSEEYLILGLCCSISNYVMGSIPESPKQDRGCLLS